MCSFSKNVKISIFYLKTVILGCSFVHRDITLLSVENFHICISKVANVKDQCKCICKAFDTIEGNILALSNQIIMFLYHICMVPGCRGQNLNQLPDFHSAEPVGLISTFFMPPSSMLSSLLHSYAIYVTHRQCSIVQVDSHESGWNGSKWTCSDLLPFIVHVSNDDLTGDCCEKWDLPYSVYFMDRDKQFLDNETLKDHDTCHVFQL